MKKHSIFKQLEKGLVVSCQALPDEPLYREEGGIMVLMAQAAVRAGAVGIRAQGVTDIKQIKDAVELPVIGLIKKPYPNYQQYITVTMDEIDALVETGCDIIALDATLRPRGDGKSIEAFIHEIKTKYPDCILMGDISTLEEGIHCEAIGMDCVGTTLSGYTDYSPQQEGPDYQLMVDLVQQLSIPVIAEGRIHSPEAARKAIECGVHCVTVGGAITRPQEITNRFVKAMNDN
ncbi:N-acetylmannosamine-6-phosphate 2-epimerase [Erysipelothrix rhusiopathiae]|nr:N-acetylmannosamine-6-phosphate 2-epimerase [Erysipelothrix rhusiopathiae]MDE8036128.1 N-acetylmannosamine-6-phosphate 2-epimerase [Erysipelothrix rhusiopathiae]MDE8039313.1 N-acetylmannosamine-6-phosphate 2-epimerase [Erysipelothrix rhusiopathiae]MDE8039531.1 N-acetylmannosamine-6-phosphate 2-epimerase [Erysipelothrix rhusiopathiae]MDE8042351.1 N-acetylmannosamine-6-phosphate 2-epimerase [Erysipelothrix rhusiopathiae]